MRTRHLTPPFSTSLVHSIRVAYWTSRQRGSMSAAHFCTHGIWQRWRQQRWRADSRLCGKHRRAHTAGLRRSTIRSWGFATWSPPSVFLLVGGVEALVMRLQLARADMKVLSPEAYNQIFTMHGVTMIFWYASPILSGFAVYLVPLMIGARDMAFPRLNAFTYWTYLFSGHLPVHRSVLGSGAACGMVRLCAVHADTIFAQASAWTSMRWR